MKTSLSDLIAKSTPYDVKIVAGGQEQNVIDIHGRNDQLYHIPFNSLFLH